MPPAGPHLSAVPTTVPTDGVITGDINCYGGDCSGLESGLLLVVESETGKSFELAPTFTTVHGASQVSVAWKPEAPLTEGMIYRVRLQAALQGSEDTSSSFVAAAALGEDFVPSVTAEFSIHESTAGVGESVCCSAGEQLSCGGFFCFATETEHKVALRLTLPDTASAWAPQFEYRAVFTAGSELVEHRSLRSFFYEQADALDADEYCYELFARRVGAPGPEIQIGEECLAKSAIETNDDFEQRYAQLPVCTVPPEALYAEWCAEVVKQPDAVARCKDTPTCAASFERCAELAMKDPPTPDSKTPDSKTPDSKTPDSKTPDSKTPDSKTPDSKTP
ncbi:MAG: hypothetical protein RJA70_4321, partial [Pseudomonadota bacterium]